MANRLEALTKSGWGRQYFADLRDRLMTDPRFISWARAFPLTRFIARRRAGALFDLCAGFVYSQILFACVKLDVFELLRLKPLTSREFSRNSGLSEEAAARLLEGAKALRLVEARPGGRFGLGPLGSAVAANPGVAAMVEHHDRLYRDLTDPVGLLRGNGGETELSAYWPYATSERPADLSESQVADYSALMALSVPLVAEEALEAHPLGRYRCLLDVGGGEGTFIAAAAAQAPSLKLMLFDLPAVAKRAETRLSQLGISDRLRVVGGDFLANPLPEGADVISLVRVILDHDDETVRRILTAVRRALPADGTLLLAEPLADMPGAEAMGGAYFGFYLMAMGRGRPRTYPQIKALLTATGFDRIALTRGRRVLRTGIVTARPHVEC